MVVTKLYDEDERQSIINQLKENTTKLSLVSIDFQLNTFLLREFELLATVSEFYAQNTHLSQFDADNMIFDEVRFLFRCNFIIFNYCK